MRALFVFCEGRHDVLFTQRCLGALGSYQFFGKSIRELPTPLGDAPVEHDGDKSYIARRIARARVGTSTLQTAAHPARPVFESVLTKTTPSTETTPSTKTIVVLLRAHGDSTAEANLELLRELGDLLVIPRWDIREYAVAFLFDADGSLDQRLERFRRKYAEIMNSAEPIDHDQWVPGTLGARGIGLHVFHDPSRRAGTLDEELERIVRQQLPDKIVAATAFIDGAKDPSDPVSVSEASRLKAVVTAAGQFSHPGDPLSRLLADRERLPRDVFSRSPLGQRLVDFLGRAPWSAD